MPKDLTHNGKISPPRDWNAVRRGLIYCAPACGGNCTWEEHQLAKRRAEALRRKMKTTGWKIHLHENLGWHFSIWKGHIAVYEYRYGGKVDYHCSCSESEGPANGTPAAWHDRRTFKNPNDAVAGQIATLRAYAATVNKTVASILRDQGV